MGEKGNVKTFWPLPTDYENVKKYSKEYLEERNKWALDYAIKTGFYKN